MLLSDIERQSSRAQTLSVVDSARFKIALWFGSVSAGKTVASLFAFLLAVRAAPKSGLIVIVGKSLQTVYQNVFVHRVVIKGLPESRQSPYAEITAMSTDPQLISMALPENRQEETKRAVGDSDQLLERRSLHLLSDKEGMFPVGKLNPDEVEVLDAEMARPGALAWSRNPTGGRDSMSIAYRDSHGEWRTLRPDFLFFVDAEEGVRASIVDPHGHWLPDAAWKLHGTARFAELYGDRFTGSRRSAGSTGSCGFSTSSSPRCAKRCWTNRTRGSPMTPPPWGTEHG